MNGQRVQTSQGRLTDEALKEILTSSKTIAVVGWSDKEERPSNEVAHYLRKQGYHVLPVNPRLAGKDWDGQPIYESLLDVPEPIDLVDVFRRPIFTPAVVEDAIAAGAKVVWMQLGVINDEAERLALKAGLTFVQNRCTQIDHLRLVRGIPLPSYS
jgi:uncharacterized protein